MLVKITKDQVNAAKSNADMFDDPSVGENFGGSFPPLELKENEVSPRLTYIKDTKIPMTKDDGTSDIKTVPVVSVEGSTELRGLPVSAVFAKHWKEANLELGSVVLIKRYADATKKRGLGAGTAKMKIYAIKVLSRPPQEKTA